MERIRFEREVKTVLRLTKKEVEILSQACESHYDAAVRALSLPGKGAILNGARTSLEFGDEEGKGEWVDVEVTSRQLDTLAKATEIHAPYASTPEATLDFTMAFRELMRDATDEWFNLNPHALEDINDALKSNGHPPKKMPKRPPERSAPLAWRKP